MELGTVLYIRLVPHNTETEAQLKEVKAGSNPELPK